MSTEPRALLDRLATLEVAYEAQRTEITSLRRALDGRATRRRHRRSAGARALAIALVALLIAIIPASLIAASPPNFIDLNPGSPHNEDIGLIAEAGITLGCEENVRYCPNGNVSREQMASFLARTAGLGGKKPVANAARLAASPAEPGGATYAANDLARVAMANWNTTALPVGTNVWTTLTTLNITAPQAGWILILADANASMGGPGCACNEKFRLTNNSGGMTIRSIDIAASDASNVGANPKVTYNGPASFSWLYFAPAGQRTVTVEGSATRAFPNAPATTTSTFGTITALFIPFGPTGNATP